jgi:hypothetical protein
MAMRNRLRALALLAVLGLSCSMRGQSNGAGTTTTGATKAPTSATPDLTGIWRRSRRAPDKARQYTIYELAMSLTNEQPPMTSWGLAQYKAAKPNLGPRAVSLSDTNDPAVNCFPPGVPRIYIQRGAPLEIFQVPGRVVMFFEYDHFVRQIFMDKREHSADLIPSWMGDAIGRWEGTTLVVDTLGFNDKGWLDNDGHPHSDALHLTERIRRASHDTLIDDVTIDDPKAYTKPWTSHMVFELKPNWNISEVICEDNVNFQDLQKVNESKK